MKNLCCAVAVYRCGSCAEKVASFQCEELEMLDRIASEAMPYEMGASSGYAIAAEMCRQCRSVFFTS